MANTRISWRIRIRVIQLRCISESGLLSAQPRWSPKRDSAVEFAVKTTSAALSAVVVVIA